MTETSEFIRTWILDLYTKTKEVYGNINKSNKKTSKKTPIILFNNKNKQIEQTEEELMQFSSIYEKIRELLYDIERKLTTFYICSIDKPFLIKYEVYENARKLFLETCLLNDDFYIYKDKTLNPADLSELRDMKCKLENIYFSLRKIKSIPCNAENLENLTINDSFIHEDHYQMIKNFNSCDEIWKYSLEHNYDYGTYSYFCEIFYTFYELKNQGKKIEPYSDQALKENDEYLVRRNPALMNLFEKKELLNIRQRILKSMVIEVLPWEEEMENLIVVGNISKHLQKKD